MLSLLTRFIKFDAKMLIMVTVCVLFIALSAYLSLQYVHINSLKHQVSNLKVANEKLIRLSKRYEKALDDNIKRNEALNNKHQEIDTTSSKQLVELNNYRERLQYAISKKPSLLQRRITNATTGVMQQYDEATGADQ